MSNILFAHERILFYSQILGFFIALVISTAKDLPFSSSPMHYWSKTETHAFGGVSVWPKQTLQRLQPSVLHPSSGNQGSFSTAVYVSNIHRPQVLREEIVLQQTATSGSALHNKVHPMLWKYKDFSLLQYFLMLRSWINLFFSSAFKRCCESPKYLKGKLTMVTKASNPLN